MLKVDLGCGPHKTPGYYGLDILNLDGVDATCDFENDALPFGDNMVDEIVTNHTLEHITNLLHLMDECYRVLKPGGELKIEVPLFPDTGAIKDPTHVRYFVPETFDYFDLAWDYPGRPDYQNKKYNVKSITINGNIPYRVINAILIKPKNEEI